MSIPKYRFTFGDTFGDTGKGEQNFGMNVEYLISRGLLSNADYRNRILNDPLWVLANDDVLLNVSPFGAANAGNNIYMLNGKKMATHLLPPAALLTPFTISMLGALKTVNLESLYNEVSEANKLGAEIIPGVNLFIDSYATLTFPQDIEVDKAFHKDLRGTLRGSGPSHARRRFRLDMRAGELQHLDNQKTLERIRKGLDIYNTLLEGTEYRKYSLDETIEWLEKYNGFFGQNFVVDGKRLINLARNNPKAHIFINGTQGLSLDGDIGTIGNTVSYGVGIQDAMKGLYLPANFVDNNTGIVIIKKAYVTRAGSGLLPGEFQGEKTQELSRLGCEIGVTSGNIRRTGPDNMAETRYQVQHSGPGITSLRITKVDVYGELMEKFGPQKAIVGYKLPDGNVVDHVGFPHEDFEIVLGEEYGWGKITDQQKRKMINEGFDAFPDGLKEYLFMTAKQTSAPVSGVSLGPYLLDTATKGLYEETSKVIN